MYLPMEKLKENHCKYYYISWSCGVLCIQKRLKLYVKQKMFISG